MKIRNAIIIFLCLITSLNLWSQNLRIEGSGSKIQGKTVRLIGVMDNLSGLEKELSRYEIGKDDTTFNFAITIDNTMLMKLRIETFDYAFVAQKGSTYKLRILPFNFDIRDSINTLFYSVPLYTKIEKSDDDALNHKLYLVDSTIQSHLFSRPNNKLFYADKKLIETLNSCSKAVVEGFSSSSNNPTSLKYIKDYAFYTTKALEYSARIRSQKSVKAEMFSDKPILYDNIGYMSTFEMVYGDYFSQGNKIFSSENLYDWLNTKNYLSLIDSMGLDPLLKNEVFRELVFLRGMKECFFKQNIDSYYIISMLEQFLYQTKFEEHKKIANNLIETFFAKSFSGNRAMDFTLKDINNKSISLEDYSDKPLILSFVKINDPVSLRELNVMHNFIDTMQHSYNFLTVACDRSLDALYNFLINSKIGIKYKWDFVHFDNKWDILEYFNIRVFPTFVMIGKDGKIKQNPMKKPSEGSLIPLIRGM